ncbi:unnamed protein product [Ilex paraguariensis]|uniref:Uncharacterized protein n=1 Tax=Ilex paraguariensis TaxID=185542 RepID=A0ABC8QSB3_9AQUA
MVGISRREVQLVVPNVGRREVQLAIFDFDRSVMQQPGSDMQYPVSVVQCEVPQDLASDFRPLHQDHASGSSSLLCCDGVFKKGDAVVGVILKDSNGFMVDGIAKRILCCDGVFKKGDAVVGVILKDSNGFMVDGIAKRIPTVSNFYSEAAVVKEACLLVSAFWAS